MRAPKAILSVGFLESVHDVVLYLCTTFFEGNGILTAFINNLHAS